MASLDVESNYFVRSFWQIVCSCCIRRCCLLVGWKIPALTNCGCASHCFEHFLLVPRWVSIHVGTGASRWSPVLQGKLLGLRGWRLPNRTWNQWTFPSMSQLTWLSIVHSIDWCLVWRYTLIACQKWMNQWEQVGCVCILAEVGDLIVYSCMQLHHFIFMS